MPTGCRSPGANLQKRTPFSKKILSRSTSAPRLRKRSADAVFERFEEIKEGLNPGLDLSKLINGHDVLDALGMRKGAPIVGKILTSIRNRLLEMDKPTRQDAIAFLYETIAFQED